MNQVPIQFNDDLLDCEKLKASENGDGCTYRADLAPGSAAWMRGTNGQPAVLRFVCPCGCGSVAGASVRPGGWTWNQSLDKPTLKPSLQLLCKCRWHGYLTNGVFIRC